MYKLFLSELRKDDDDLPAFRSRFEQAARKVKQHRVELPQEALGFLFLKQAKINGESFERLITLTKGDLKFDSVVEGLRRLKMRLLMTSAMHVSIEHHEDDDMELIEQALADLDAEEHCS